MKTNITTATIMLVLLALTNCQSTTYSVKGDGIDWTTQPIQILGSDRVTPIFNVELPKEIGGGTVPVPVIIPDRNSK